MSGVLDISDRNWAYMRWPNTLLHFWLLLLDGLRAPGKGGCKCYHSSCSYHFPGTWITEIKHNKKTESKGKDAAATVAIFQAQTLTVTATRSNVFLSPAQHHNLCQKMELVPLNLSLKLVLLSTHSTDVASHTAPPLSLLSGARSGTLPLLGWVCLEKDTICNSLPYS